MHFNVTLNHGESRTFKKVILNGQDCIMGTPKGSDTGEDISVVRKDGEQVNVYPSTVPGKVLYPVSRGDYITVVETVDEALWVHCYRVTSISDTEVIGSPC